MPRTFLGLACGLLLFFGCEGKRGGPSFDEGAATMQLTSTAFKNEETVPKKYTADGENISPPLSWSGAPEGTKSFAIICDDPDAPRGTWTHWLMYNLPPDTHELSAATPTTETSSNGARQGKNDFGKIGYGGPAPPKGKPHRYFFKVYAVDTMLELPAGVTREQLEKALDRHVLAHGQLMGKYGR
jgi:Raf kinase inhibitor-like YbhB/YbcL family protein